MIKNIPMILTIVLMLAQCGMYLWAKDHPQALLVFAYAIANTAVVWSTI